MWSQMYRSWIEPGTGAGEGGPQAQPAAHLAAVAAAAAHAAGANAQTCAGAVRCARTVGLAPVPGTEQQGWCGGACSWGGPPVPAAKRHR